MVSSSYYKRLAQNMLGRAKNATNAVEASRFQRSAKEYLVLAETVQEETPTHAPKSSELRRQSQQQQQPKSGKKPVDSDE
jgi:hypothetical protein